MFNCPLCGTPDVQIAPPIGDSRVITCKGCGNFSISGSTHARIQSYSSSDTRLLRIAYWVYEQSRLGATSVITDNVCNFVEALPPPSTQRRLENILNTAVELTNHTIEEDFSIEHPRLRVSGYCRNSDEIWGFIKYWTARGAFSDQNSPLGFCTLTIDGLLAYDEIFPSSKASSQAFVAMWFDKDVRDTYTDGIMPAISAAGYRPVRVDQIDHNGKIDDQIIAEIRRSRFVVADFTGHRGGVYYEAGFAHGLGLEVIFTCRQDHLVNLHFDVRQYAAIIWERPDQLRRLLQNRILATLGAGPGEPNAGPIPELAT